ncbi:MAG: hypothetical protein ACXVBW_03800 [Bdellovibrionota bacterium]
MTKSKFERVLVLGGVAVMALTALYVPKKSIAASIEEGIESETPEAREDLERSLRLSESVQGRQRLIELSQRLKMSARDVSEFFKEESRSGEASKESAQAWSKLLKAVSLDGSEAEAQDSEILAETVNAFIRLKRSGAAGEFHIGAKDLVEIQKSFNLDQRTNFARVLRRASEIARNGSAGTLEDAFTKALGDLGFLEKYRQGCQR